MKKLAAFFSLVRWTNLLFILITQVCFYFFVYAPLYGLLAPGRAAWLAAASILIAAGGYIINDYFDINIDRINKPSKNVVDVAISRRWAILWHGVLSGAGLLCTALAVGRSGWYLVLANGAAVLLLWFYSTSFKRKLLIGNFVIALLTAWTILVFFFAFTRPGDAILTDDLRTVKLFRIAFLYAAFAFILSLIREALKDLEDWKGDARYGCRTLPIVAGFRTTKIYIGVWLMVLIACLLILQLYILQFGWWWMAVYSGLLIILPLGILLRRLRPAGTVASFAALSRLSKWIMLAGILSTAFFRLYL